MSRRQPSGEERFTITVSSDCEVATIAPVGELDLATSDRVADAVGDLVRAGRTAIVMDLRRVRFIDSQGLRMLLVLRNDAKRNGHRLSLLPPPAPARRVFELTRTAGLFDWRAMPATRESG